jgi:hypothetical protein
MGTRPEFQSLLEDLVGEGVSVYFQPPSNVNMAYPAVVYNRDFQNARFADNTPYLRTFRYQVTIIDPSPDSVVIPKIADLPRTTFVRHFTTDNLNHDIYNVYY